MPPAALSTNPPEKNTVGLACGQRPDRSDTPCSARHRSMSKHTSWPACLVFLHTPFQSRRLNSTPQAFQRCQNSWCVIVPWRNPCLFRGFSLVCPVSIVLLRFPRGIPVISGDPWPAHRPGPTRASEPSSPQGSRRGGGGRAPGSKKTPMDTHIF